MYKKKFEKYQYEIMTAIILLTYLIYYLPVIDEVIDWCITPYTLSYRLGFISRGFMGSLIRLVIPNLTIKHIYVIILFNILLLCGMTIFFVHKILVAAYDKNKSGIVFLLGLFLINPGSIAFLFSYANYGRFDMYLLMNLLIVAMLLIYDRCIWITPVLCIGAVLTHQAYVFQYFPAVLILLFYSAFVQKKKHGKEILIITLLGTCAMFLYMQFFSHINYTYEETLAIIDTTTDLPPHFITQDMMVKIEYFSSVFETFGVFVKIPFGRNVVKSLTIIVLLLPMIKILADLWKSFVAAHNNILCRLIPWFILVAEIPMFVLTCDYGRDYAAMILSNFIVIFTLYALGDEGIRSGVETLTDKIHKNPVYYGFVAVLCAMIGKFTAADICDVGHRMYILLTSIFF